MSIIRTRQYIDINDLPNEAQRVYKEFCSVFGLGNGEHWGWMLGEKEKDSIPAGYVGMKNVRLVDSALKNLTTLKDGDEICLVFDW